MSDKTRENRLRRMAARQGLRLEKSRSRNPRVAHFGTYWLVTGNNTVECGDTNIGYGLSLDEIEACLTAE